jgi:hypothetical protein
MVVAGAEDVALAIDANAIIVTVTFGEKLGQDTVSVNRVERTASARASTTRGQEASCVPVEARCCSVSGFRRPGVERFNSMGGSRASGSASLDARSNALRCHKTDRAIARDSIEGVKPQ